MISLVINYSDTLAFYMHAMHDANYDTSIIGLIAHQTMEVCLTDYPTATMALGVCPLHAQNLP
jgi:hypothetical protein